MERKTTFVHDGGSMNSNKDASKTRKSVAMDPQPLIMPHDYQIATSTHLLVTPSLPQGSLLALLHDSDSWSFKSGDFGVFHDLGAWDGVRLMVVGGWGGDPTFGVQDYGNPSHFISQGAPNRFLQLQSQFPFSLGNPFYPHLYDTTLIRSPVNFGTPSPFPVGPAAHAAVPVPPAAKTHPAVNHGAIPVTVSLSPGTTPPATNLVVATAGPAAHAMVPLAATVPLTTETTNPVVAMAGPAEKTDLDE